MRWIVLRLPSGTPIGSVLATTAQDALRQARLIWIGGTIAVRQS